MKFVIYMLIAFCAYLFAGWLFPNETALTRLTVGLLTVILWNQSREKVAVVFVNQKDP